jgi:PAS domain S-box-containing protein
MSPQNRPVARLSRAPALSWDHYRLLVESVADYAIFMLDPNGLVVSWNLGAEKTKGYRAEEIIGHDFSKFYPAEDVAAGKPKRVLQVAAESGRYEEEGWRVRKDGSRFWASVVITALHDESGALLGFAKVTRDLSDRRRAEEELRRSEERFRLLVESVSDYAIYMLDEEGRVATWNLGAERLTGYSVAEVLGKSFAAFFPREDVAAGKPAQELSVARQQGRFEDENWRVRKDGSRFWANAILTAMHDSHGTLIGFAKVTRDLSARREAEETERHLLRERTAREVAERAELQLRESEERFRGLSRRLEIILEGVADGITAQDSSGRIVFANSAAAHLCGFGSSAEMLHASPEDVVARFEVMDEDGRPLHRDEFPGRRALAGEESASAVLRVRERTNHREFYSFVRSTAVPSPGDAPTLAINIWHDVTLERTEDLRAKYLMEATAALASSLEPAEMLSALAQVLIARLADVCAIYLREDDQLRSAAFACSERSSVARSEGPARHFISDRQQGHALWSVLRSGASEWHAEVGEDLWKAIAQDAEYAQALRGAALKTALITPIVIRARTIGVIALLAAPSERHPTASDIDVLEEIGRRAGNALENAELYQQAQRSATIAEEASRAKDEFLATVSHELRTPLNAILGWSTILKGRQLDAAVSKPLEVIHRNAQAQVRIIDDILDVSRVITGKFRIEPKPADLVAIVREALEVVRPSAVARRIELQFSPANEVCLLVADAERLQQVVWNLLSNAIKFTEAGGTVNVAVAQEGSNYLLSVSDTGKGIDPEFLPFVFDRFKQSDSSFTRRVGGLGLGLALVRHIVELHGGRVVARSEGPGKGATFTITLPITAVLPAPAEFPAAAPSLRSAPPAVAVLNGVQVLVVDDEPDARELVAEVLIEAGAVVETARSAADGFAVFRRSRPDVLVSDIGMPDEDGFSFMRRIRALPAEEGGRLPSLALTAFAREQDRTKAIQNGFTTHIGKPVNPDALVSAVANLAAVARRN